MTALVLAAATLAGTAPAAAEGEDFTNLQLEQLMAMEVTGVTRRAASYSNSPAAIFVLTGEDIRRAGARTIADVLRLVPGLQVTRTNAQTYTVTSRGFGGDKLQVLLDGRSVYAPLTSTVFWDVFDTYFEDIQRIEVIRGPGATVWGANAVNGVINIVTRPASDSAGTHLEVGGGTEELAFGGFRSGGSIGGSAHGRAYAKARERDASERANGSEVVDGLSQIQAGARIDTALGTFGDLSVQGDVYTSGMYSTEFDPTAPGFVGDTTDTEVSGFNFGGRWNLAWGAGATEVQLYYDGYQRFAPTLFGEERDTYDLNLVHHVTPLGDHLVTVGTGARVTSDETARGTVLVFEPADRRATTWSALLQDEWAFADGWWLIAGSKFEHNDFTGFEVQPGVRLGWAATKRHFTWTSVAHAVRTPNRIDHDIGIVCTGVDTPIAGCPGAGQVLAVGNKDFHSEKLIAYEWGLRSQWTPAVLTDLALFYNDYSDLRSTESSVRFDNRIEAEGYGGELLVSWEIMPALGLQWSYSYLRVDARRDPSSVDTSTVGTLEGAPQQQSGLRLSWQPLVELQLDTFVRYVDNLPAQRVPNYTELDLRAGWQVTPFFEFAVVGQNLLDRAHPEGGANPVTRSEQARSALGQVTWRWK